MHQETFELNCSPTSLALDSTLVVVVEMSLSADESELLSRLHRWRNEAEKRLDCRVSRI